MPGCIIGECPVTVFQILAHWKVYEKMLMRIIRLIFLTVAVLLLLTPLLTASEEFYYSEMYGWRVDLPPGFEIDDTQGPQTIALKIGGKGVLTIESDLPAEYFWDTDSAINAITRVMGFAVNDVQINVIEPGETESGMYIEDIYYSSRIGSEKLSGMIRLYAGVNGVALCYRDSEAGFDANFERVQKFADRLYFPALEEVLENENIELVEFTNPVYGYRINYPSILTRDDVWYYISLSFIHESIIDIYAETRLGEDQEALIEGSKLEVLAGLEGYEAEIIKETEGVTDDGIPFMDIVVTDNDISPWVKRARIFALPDTALRLEFYCPVETFELRDEIFTAIADSLEYNPLWITEESYSYSGIPVEEVYEYGEFEWVEYTDDEFGYSIDVPDFLEPEKAGDFLFFNYDFEPILTLVREKHPGFDKEDALVKGEENSETEFGVLWDYTRYGDESGVSSEGLPYVEFYLDDNDPYEAWTQVVRVYGLDELSVRIEMYASPERLEVMDAFFDKVADSFTVNDE